MGLENIDAHVTKDYEIKERLGKGAYGIVWKAVEKKSGDTVAIKKIFDAFRNVTDAQRTFREIIYLKEFSDHENIVTLLDVMKSENDTDMYLVFEHMDVDLHMATAGKLLQPEHIPHIMAQCLNALRYMHSGGVIHRDLKPSNILLNDSCHARLADFGLARSVKAINRSAGKAGSDVDPTMTDYVATRWYRSPEILLGSTRYTTGTDIWSMGCILGEMLSGRPIFRGSSSMNQLEVISQTLGPPTLSDVRALASPYARNMLKPQGSLSIKPLVSIVPKASKSALGLLAKMLLYSPDKRLSAEACLTHKYLLTYCASHRSPPRLKSVDVKTPFDDNQRLTIRDYRTRLYEDIIHSQRIKKESSLAAARGDSSAGEEVVGNSIGRGGSASSRSSHSVRPETCAQASHLSQRASQRSSRPEQHQHTLPASQRTTTQAAASSRRSARPSISHQASIGSGTAREQDMVANESDDGDSTIREEIATHEVVDKLSSMRMEEAVQVSSSRASHRGASSTHSRTSTIPGWDDKQPNHLSGLTDSTSAGIEGEGLMNIYGMPTRSRKARANDQRNSSTVFLGPEVLVPRAQSANGRVPLASSKWREAQSQEGIGRTEEPCTGYKGGNGRSYASGGLTLESYHSHRPVSQTRPW